jgi:hypothetical protein
MDKHIKEAIDLNGTMSVSLNQGSILIRVYETSSQIKYVYNDDLSISTCDCPLPSGEIKVELSSDIFTFDTDTISIKGFREYYIKTTYIWLLDKALPYLAKTADEYESEVIITNHYDEEAGTFESYASLEDDMPILLLAMNQK